MRPVLPLLLSPDPCAPALTDWIARSSSRLVVAAAPGLSRWLIVHNLPSAAADGLPPRRGPSAARASSPGSSSAWPRTWR
ncbi:hypothetical protein P4234_31210 [Pseudomonas aeruginosa]|nr:hypothetical protein [Pseudomonas aeruginosa]